MTGTEDRLEGASTWEQDLYSNMKAHLEEEVSLLSEYSAAAESTTSRAFAYLVRLLMNDERSHHMTMEALSATLKHDAELGGAMREVPYLDLYKAEGRMLMELTQKLLDRERQDAKSLKRLAKRLRDVDQNTLWGLLVSNMRRDTDKHIAVLKFVLRHAHAGNRP
jgi:hypothetical protein